MMEIKTNGSCTNCIHFSVCKNEPSKQDLIKILQKLDMDIKTFEICIECPNFKERSCF